MNWGDNFVLLETLRRDKLNKQNLLFTNPIDVITCLKKNELAQCFRRIDSYLQKGFYLAGFFSYELGYFLDEAFDDNNSQPTYPLIWLCVYNKPRKLTAASSSSSNHYYLSSPVMETGMAEYKKVISKIKNLICRGETYQINFTSKYHFNFFGNVFDFYDQLKANQQVSYSALINHGGNYIISLSPELFFRIEKQRKIIVKPMKGTAPTSVPAGWLQTDAKNTSENVMIVDLLRNDLGRICQTGSVKVAELFAVEEYATLLQMTSTVTGKLRTEVKISDIIKSLFPCGSVTGAPKIQSMKIIHDLEKNQREIYAGAIGYLSPDGQAAFNVAIRTIDLQSLPDKKYKASMGVGGGIVFDSRPEEEYKECLLKAHFLINSIPDFALIETMRLDDGKIKYLDLHLRRLKMSAQYFGIYCISSTIKRELLSYAKPLSGQIRIRLLLKSTGKIVVEHQPLITTVAAMPVITVSAFKTQSNDPFMYHKTTHRKLYEEEYEKTVAKGYFDVIFMNEKNQITEGAISNIFLEIQGQYYTPALDCGLLNGIGRKILMNKLKAQEKILYLRDLKSAAKIIMTNSVRGATEVMLNI